MNKQAISLIFVAMLLCSSAAYLISTLFPRRRNPFIFYGELSELAEKELINANLTILKFTYVKGEKNESKIKELRSLQNWTRTNLGEVQVFLVIKEGEREKLELKSALGEWETSEFNLTRIRQKLCDLLVYKPINCLKLP